MPPVKSSNLTSGREVGEGRKKENYLLARSPCPPINGRKMRLILGVVAQHSRAGWILPQLGVILQAAGDKEVRLNDAAWAGTSRPSLYTTLGLKRDAAAGTTWLAEVHQHFVAMPGRTHGGTQEAP